MVGTAPREGLQELRLAHAPRPEDVEDVDGKRVRRKGRFESVHLRVPPHEEPAPRGLQAIANGRYGTEMTGDRGGRSAGEINMFAARPIA